ncbi:MAG: AraC family transcriptional regulator [Hyphomicrobiales bacterium]|nr:MAG: AraC family transcriptional regulator [Hyphomicrobiales bacterium]
MTTAAADRYLARMRRVLAHIDAHPESDLGLDALCDVAAFSKFHFHRQFTATFGVPVRRHVQLVRLERAVHRLAYRTNETVTDIAFGAGYDAPDAFARAFRRHFGQTPSAFRRCPDRAAWQTALEPLANLRKKSMTAYSPMDVEIVSHPTVRVAVLEHHGNPADLHETIRRFIEWRKATGLGPQKSATYNVFHSDPQSTPADAFRLDICAASDRPIAANGSGVREGAIPGGRCARLRVVGCSDLEEPATWLYREWLPASGEELRDFPIFCERKTLFPDVSEGETITDLFLPLREK